MYIQYVEKYSFLQELKQKKNHSFNPFAPPLHSDSPLKNPYKSENVGVVDSVLNDLLRSVQKLRNSDNPKD
ncbi:hypothetical protein BpHYR1_002542 [Brachionus plicatilis]|uniref:Uncharacterized protein n=1 Tax=Brachionus plicatilis TaxID=10195 RepID=A0A3M7S2C7_BRAPC|nr:hypothetical protein BpHYR1_002542 [Brachionus plicatilis]